MAEWPNAPVLKTGVPQGTGGSNPSLSATVFRHKKPAAEAAGRSAQAPDRRRRALDYSATVIDLIVNRRLASVPTAETTLPSLSAKVLPSPFTMSTL